MYLNDLQFYDRQAENRIEFGGVRIATVDATVDGMGICSLADFHRNCKFVPCYVDVPSVRV